MKQFFYVLPLALCPVSAQVADAQSACVAALDAVRAAQSENVGPVVTAVLEATGGDERVFPELMKKAADAGHPVALTWLAKQALAQLRAQRVNTETAPAAMRLRAVVEQAAAAGYVPAVLEMAHLCGSGVGAPPDEEAGMKYLMQACRANSPRARAAYLLLSGRMEKEGAESAAVVAELKRNNFYVEELLSTFAARTDKARSQEWLSLASSHGSPGAAYALGLYYLQQKKDALGYDFLKLAVERDSPEAMARMASLMLPGTPLSPELQKIIKPDSIAAIRLFQRAALLGYTPALIPLAGEYRKHPGQYSAERVFELYRHAADAGDPRGGVAYAYCLVEGRGCSPDAERGLHILEQLAGAGVPLACLAMADLHFNGVGTPASMEKAMSSLMSASMRGLEQSYTLMAVLTQLGNADTPANPSKAQIYLQMAETQGEHNPRQVFDSMVKAGSWKFMP